MTRPWLVAGCLVALALPASAAGRGVRWADADLDAAMARARDTDRLVLVDCWAPWCRFCYEMDDNVWSLPELARVVEQETVPLRLEVDVRRGVGTAFARRYRVEGLPLVLLLDPRDGRVLRRLEGYQSAEAIVAAIDAARGEQATSRAAEASDDPAVLVREGSRRERAGDPDGAERLWRRALALDADCAAGAADDAALSLATIVARRDGPEAADALLADALGRCRRPDERDALWARRVELAGLRGPDELLAIVLARHEDRPDDDEAALEAARLLVERGREPERAEAIARALAERLPDDPRPAGLLARIALARGRLDEAADWVSRAIAIDPHDLDLRELRLRIELARRADAD